MCPRDADAPASGRCQLRVGSPQACALPVVRKPGVRAALAMTSATEYAACHAGTNGFTSS
jgi:hypothetical protein